MQERTLGWTAKRFKVPTPGAAVPNREPGIDEAAADVGLVLERVKNGRVPGPRQGDMLALQRSLGNKAIRGVLSRYWSPAPRAAGVIQAQRDTALLQRHQIPDDRRAVGEEDDEIGVQRLVDRQAAFGRMGPRPEPVKPWARGAPNAVQRNKWKSATPTKAAPPAKGWKSASAGEEAKKTGEREYWEFVKGGPYAIKDYVPDTVEDFGKFDASYDPAKKLLTADMRVKFVFPDIVEPKGDTLQDKLDRAKIFAIKQLYIGSFINQVHKGWSGKFSFRNVREPQSVWGRLNPIRVKVNVTPVTTNQHYTLEGWLKKVDVANVAPNQGPNANRVQLFKGDLDPTKSDFTNDPNVGKGELARLQRNLPKIRFGPSSTAIDAKYIPDLKFIADYLRRMNVPKFKLNVIGHASRTGKEPVNLKFSQARAQAVADQLTAFGVTNHTMTVKGLGSAGATPHGSWRKVDIVPTLEPGFKNVQDITLHEFGHMLGLDDEYVRGKSDKRSHTTQQKWMQKMLGDPSYGKGKASKYADEVTKVDPKFSASVMERGSEIRAYHYVTLWQALYDTAAKAPKQPAAPLTWKDWKVVE